MPITKQRTWNRRCFLYASLLVPASVTFDASRPRLARAAPTLTPTPACGNETTLQQTAGPFFKPNSPETQSLIEPGIEGERFFVQGLVLSTQCEPVANALVDLWHADSQGRYDNQGFRLRGHQYTNATGRFCFETIVAGHYGPRTRHYHVRVQAPGQAVLTTQLYFPEETRNATDFLFRRELLMAASHGPNGSTGRFDFVVEVG